MDLNAVESGKELDTESGADGGEGARSGARRVAQLGTAGYRGMVFTSWTASVFDKMVENVDALNAYVGMDEESARDSGLTNARPLPSLPASRPEPARSLQGRSARDVLQGRA